MATVLVLNSSASGADSVSRQLVQSTVSRLRSQNPGLHVVERDLDTAPVPHLNAETTAAVRAGINGTPAQRDALALSNALVEELKAADTIVIGAPMYNFGIPSTLKSWFDYVLRAGITFSYSEAGPEGLLKNKRAIVVESRGGLYSSGPAQVMDSQEPHLRTMLGFAGITDVTFIRAEKLGYGPEAREEAIRNANAELALVA
ncbi:FMN-dependent NADH-azoreductase [Bosea thiooxidans]|uniref:FMN dependent NADH:quinone oxidoreductase n=1 Tax=Bosea thiooxidans TaxID=53254 RepID=A0A0Q3L594_9HYPH|nr:FMN-dependent NADH-azoreductase [Bosea thiooxidans]KQK31956.1 FMN-dependent NADH-azoreductase [Bosea thiooxidans]SKB52100.1 FMN-dependent NADH-azoreductase [Bosea thiooxidans]